MIESFSAKFTTFLEAKQELEFKKKFGNIFTKGKVNPHICFLYWFPAQLKINIDFDNIPFDSFQGTYFKNAQTFILRCAA